MALKFGVKKLNETGADPSPPTDDARIAFFCPGCGRSFEQSAKAAGRKTKCPQCATVFAIPATAPSPVVDETPDTDDDPVDVSAAPQPAADTESAIAAAVAAYNAGLSPQREPSKWIVPTGLMLLLLGGVLSVTGSFLMVKGYFKAFGLEDLMGGKGVDLGKIVGGVFGGRNQVMQDLLQDIDNPNRRPRNRPAQPNTGINAKKVAEQVQGQQQNLKQQLAERKAKREEGQSLVMWGVITHGTGKVVTFIGGIFLLAGLLGRILRPREPAPASQ